MERTEIQMAEPAPSRTGVRLAMLAAVCLVSAGGLLWWKEGGAVFSQLVTSTLAWCF